MSELRRGALALLALALSGCVELDFALFPSAPASLDDYDFTSPDLDGIDPARITSELIPLGDEGERIHVLYVERDPAKLDPRIAPEPALTVIYNHGNWRNNLHYWARVGYFEELGFNVLLYDYRGYGASDGETTEAHISEDAEAAYDYARGRDGEAAILSYGYSLGGTAATHLCAPESGREVIGCFTEAAFASVQSLVDASTGYDLPATFLAGAEFDNVGRVARFEVPILIMQGTADATVAYHNGELLWAAARDRDARSRFFPVEGAAHSTVPTPSYRDASGEATEPNEYSYPEELPPELRAELRVWQGRLVDFVVDLLTSP